MPAGGVQPLCTRGSAVAAQRRQGALGLKRILLWEGKESHSGAPSEGKPSSCCPEVTVEMGGEPGSWCHPRAVPAGVEPLGGSGEQIEEGTVRRPQCMARTDHAL